MSATQCFWFEIRMLSTLVIRQHSGDYDSLQNLNLGADVDVVEICGIREAQVYLKQQGYNYFINDNYTANRLVKFLPNPKYKLKVYLDSSINIKDQEAFVRLIKKSTRENFSLMLCMHPDRKTVSDELEACYMFSKISRAQYNHFKDNNEIQNNSQKLTQNGIIISKYNENFRKWSEDFVTYLDRHDIKRDQIILPLFLEKKPLDNIMYQKWPNFVSIEAHKRTFKHKFTKKINYMRRRFEKRSSDIFRYR